MNKTWTLLSLTLALYGTSSFAGTQGAVVLEENGPWTGFYIGANAGYLWTANNIVENISNSVYSNPFFPASPIITNSLNQIGNHSLFNSSNGFIGGAQIGYNAEIPNHVVVGIDADLDAVGQSDKTAEVFHRSTTVLGTYSANITATKKLDYLGFIKGRLGMLVSPSILVYGTGAFSYGGASLRTSYAITHTQQALLPIYADSKESKMLAGWGAGGGAEWLFNPKWSVKLEYMFYNLGPIHNVFYLNQLLNDGTRYSGTQIESIGKFTGNTLKLGVNYHFA